MCGQENKRSDVVIRHYEETHHLHSNWDLGSILGPRTLVFRMNTLK